MNMNEKYDDFFKKAEEHEELKEKYQLIKDGKRKNKHLFISRREASNSEGFGHYIRSFECRLEKKQNKFFFILLSFFALFTIICNIEFFKIFELKNAKEVIHYIYWLILFNCIISGFLFLFSYFSSVFLYFIYENFGGLIYYNHLYKKLKLKKIFSIYFYSPKIHADKKYITAILSENKYEKEKIKKFDKIISKRNYITYFEINKIFGLTKIESELMYRHAMTIFYIEIEEYEHNQISEKTHAFMSEHR